MNSVGPFLFELVAGVAKVLTTAEAKFPEIEITAISSTNGNPFPIDAEFQQYEGTLLQNRTLINDHRFQNGCTHFFQYPIPLNLIAGNTSFLIFSVSNKNFGARVHYKAKSK